MTLRLQAMELVVKRLNKEGFFTLNQLRNFVCIVVEVMPPEAINRAIALRLLQQ
ncbi:DUF4303 domain-containing protein [Lysinibacillus fusiformis]|uniref:DUF4303 domain-containing protein n=1 Tax=Lysinibacillus fusiformis TaxID=28031 RepID=UPI003D01DF8F